MNRCTCNHVCPSRYEREVEEIECVHISDCELMRQPTTPPADVEMDLDHCHKCGKGTTETLALKRVNEGVVCWDCDALADVEGSQELLPCPFKLDYVVRFLGYVKEHENGCWNWLGCTNNRGYGSTSGGSAGKTVLAHRRSYEIFRGAIPDGLLVLHKCNNRACVNPAHLYAGTQVQNMADAKEAGTFPMGERNGFAKHSTSTVNEVKRLLAEGVNQSETARRLGISRGIVSNIATGKWRRNG